MKLSFGTVINDQPNYFIEKIWKGLMALSSHLDNEHYRYQERHIQKFDRNWDGDSYTEFLEPKIHTIIKDPDGFWHPGTEIAMVIYKDTVDEFQFAPMLHCIRVQKIEIRQSAEASYTVSVDGNPLDDEQLNKLAINDGFPSAEELLSYFSGDFSGKLIHWTAMKY
jgi:hypothetical protein